MLKSRKVSRDVPLDEKAWILPSLVLTKILPDPSLGWVRSMAVSGEEAGEWVAKVVSSRHLRGVQGVLGLAKDEG